MEKKINPGNSIGKYLIEERVGRGGMAEVFKAYHESLNRHVAIKIMHPYLSDDRSFLSRFQREARAMAAAEHPNIVHVYDFDVEDEYYYIVMEFLSGGTLKNKIDQLSAAEQTMSLPAAVHIILEMADALAYAHSCSMIHRDLKPANIMFNERGRAVLTDFGIAKLLTSTSYMTNTGAMIGTPAYMSPEQGLGEQGDERSDIYSLGILAYQLLAGRLPHEGGTPLSVVLKHINDSPIRPTVFNPELSVELENVVLKAMAKEKEDRYQSASEVGRALRHVLDQTDHFEDQFDLPAALLEQQPTPLPGKTMHFAHETPGGFLEAGPVAASSLVSENPTVIGEAGFASSVPVESIFADGSRGTNQKSVRPDSPAKIEIGSSTIDPVDEKRSPSESPHSISQNAHVSEQNHEGPNDGNFSSEMSAALDRLTEDPDPTLSTQHMRRLERRAEAELQVQQAQRRKGLHLFVMTLIIVAGLSIGMFAYQNYFGPDIIGDNPVQQFNSWLNRATGGQTADDVDLNDPALQLESVDNLSDGENE